jgi:hypothetical protein
MITRTNSSFGFSKSTLIFTASSSSLVLSIQPGPSFNASRSTCGVIIDSVSILPINVLPIELISFDAIRKNDNIQINWGVASQTNNKVFELEQSNDAKIFKKIKIIEGAGTITDYKLYTVVDTAFYTSNVYYRLKQIDWDGSYTYSEIISVQELQDELIQVITYPNPASELLYLQTTSNDFKVEVFNMEGNLMNVKESDPIHHTIDLSNLQAGFYLIKIVFPEKVIIKKIEHI